MLSYDFLFILDELVVSFKGSSARHCGQWWHCVVVSNNMRTISLPQATEIGKEVNALRKHQAKRVRSLAKGLVR